MIVDEIEPIIDELTRLKGDISAVDTNSKVELSAWKVESEKTHEHMYADLEKVQAENEKNF